MQVFNFKVSSREFWNAVYGLLTEFAFAFLLIFLMFILTYIFMQVVL
jgi:hypothetical protein